MIHVQSWEKFRWKLFAVIVIPITYLESDDCKPLKDVTA